MDVTLDAGRIVRIAPGTAQQDGSVTAIRGEIFGQPPGHRRTLAAVRQTTDQTQIPQCLFGRHPSC
jgi:hypothetical protein